jgi:phosphate acetyltransferase
MSDLEKIFARARKRNAKVVFPELADPRVAEAADRLAADGLCQPIPLSDISEFHVAVLTQARGMKEAIARRLLSKPLYRAAAMVAVGEADAMVAGADSPTKRVIEAASIAIGLDETIKTPSSFFLMLFAQDRSLVFADCAVNVAPTQPELVDIARATAASATGLLGSARLAMLSYSTGASGQGASVDLVASATAELQRVGVDCFGPIQADAALNQTIGAKKGVTAGDFNVLVFPDLNAGNIGYKLCQELAGAQALGPFLQGFRKPVCDLSRGATVADIVAATAVTVAIG